MLGITTLSFLSIAGLVSAVVRHARYEGVSCLLPCWSRRRDVDVEWMLQTSQGETVVHVKGDGHDHLLKQYPAFKGRTSLDVEQMKGGNMSLVLRDARKSDEGSYIFYVHPGKHRASEVQLLVAQLSPLEVSIEGHGRGGVGVLLQCVSGGWPAEPELEWWDGEGRFLPADVTQTGTLSPALTDATLREAT
ncbi:butyrophilin subfamily 3 member A2-like isoform X2 [Hypomesus transpacificus]|uniref:butyrophilin subfamily 3 member A2-like isoform X2 n=1 Tax=Hypomesus transpacificus TaxID=137520 RepID=UPI001F075B05|nr:butyrophilin subfamily 3 member A2-like isoform X2 [Hypomesus transpacificus]